MQSEQGVKQGVVFNKLIKVLATEVEIIQLFYEIYDGNNITGGYLILTIKNAGINTYEPNNF